jgi:hypothetical protein
VVRGHHVVVVDMNGLAADANTVTLHSDALWAGRIPFRQDQASLLEAICNGLERDLYGARSAWRKPGFAVILAVVVFTRERGFVNRKRNGTGIGKYRL